MAKTKKITKTTRTKKTTAPAVIVRTFSAGVHYGHLAGRSADWKCVRLTDAKRIWSWEGARTLHEISLHGVGPGSRVSERVAEITLTEAIEIIVCTGDAATVLEAAAWQA